MFQTTGIIIDTKIAIQDKEIFQMSVIMFSNSAPFQDTMNNTFKK